MARVIAYLYFFLAGETAALAAWLIQFGPNSLLDQFGAHGWNVQLGLLPGVATACAGLLLHKPFAQLLAAGRWRVAMLFVFPGVALAHLLYVVLVFFAFVAQHAGVQHSGAPLLGLLDDALWQAGIYGLFSVILAFLPNLFFALNFTLVALWVWRRHMHRAAPPAAASV